MSDLKKVRVELLNEATGDVIEDVDVLTNSTCVSYNNTVPTVTALGGISAGTTFVDKSVCEILDSLLYPYLAPTITISANPAGGVFEKGSSITPSINLTATKKSLGITSGGVYVNDSLIQSVTFGATGSTQTANLAAITTNSLVTGKVSDGQSTISSGAIPYDFVYPAYVGSVGATGTVTIGMITALSKKIMKPATFSNLYTLTNERMCIALPEGWTLSKIFDPNSFDMISAFDSYNIGIKGLDNTTVTYTIYLQKTATTQSNFNVTFTK